MTCSMDSIESASAERLHGRTGSEHRGRLWPLMPLMPSRYLPGPRPSGGLAAFASFVLLRARRVAEAMSIRYGRALLRRRAAVHRSTTNTICGRDARTDQIGLTPC